MNYEEFLKHKEQIEQLSAAEQKAFYAQLRVCDKSFFPSPTQSLHSPKPFKGGGQKSLGERGERERGITRFSKRVFPSRKL